jgi:hypothetical protein
MKLKVDPFVRLERFQTPHTSINRKKRRPKAKIHKITQEKTEKTCEL